MPGRGQSGVHLQEDWLKDVREARTQTYRGAKDEAAKSYASVARSGIVNVRLAEFSLLWIWPSKFCAAFNH
jgi:hypothetical protein